jgi:hypothetical protein
MTELSPAVRLGIFALALVVVFAAAFLLGRLAGAEVIGG